MLPMRDGRTDDDEQGKIELLIQMEAGWLSFAKPVIWAWIIFAQKKNTFCPDFLCRFYLITSLMSLTSSTPTAPISLLLQSSPFLELPEPSTSIGIIVSLVVWQTIWKHLHKLVLKLLCFQDFWAVQGFHLENCYIKAGCQVGGEAQAPPGGYHLKSQVHIKSKINIK